MSLRRVIHNRRKSFCAALFAAAFFAIALPVSAAIQTVHGTGLYQMGEADTIQQAKENAKQDALRNAAEQAGVYVRSHTETKNLTVTDDEVTTIASQLLKVKSVDFTQEYKDNTLVFHATVTATFDDSNLEKALMKEQEVSALQKELDAEKKKNEKIKLANDKEHVSDETSLFLWEAYENAAGGAPWVAVKDLSNFIKSRGGVVPTRAYYLRCVAYIEWGKYNEALSDIKKAIADDPTNPLYHTTEAIVHLGVVEWYKMWDQPGEARSEMFKAEVCCDTALQYDKRYWPAYFWRAYEKFVRESPRKAHDDIETCMKRGGKEHLCAINLYNQLESLKRNNHHGIEPDELVDIDWEYDPDYKVEK